MWATRGIRKDAWNVYSAEESSVLKLHAELRFCKAASTQELKDSLYDDDPADLTGICSSGLGTVTQVPAS